MFAPPLHSTGLLRDKKSSQPANNFDYCSPGGPGGVGRTWGVCALGKGDGKGPWHKLRPHSWREQGIAARDWLRLKRSALTGCQRTGRLQPAPASCLICIPHGGTNGRKACQTMTTMPTTIHPALTVTSVCRKPVPLHRGPRVTPRRARAIPRRQRTAAASSRSSAAKDCSASTRPGSWFGRRTSGQRTVAFTWCPAPSGALAVHRLSRRAK